MRNRGVDYKNGTYARITEKTYFFILVVVVFLTCANTLDSASATNTIGTVIILPDSPKITSIVAADPSNSAAGFSNGDTITVRFSESTNRPGGTGTQSKLQVDSLFSFSDPLGDGYSGQWVNPSTFVITVNNVGAANPQIGSFEITVTGAITNAAETSLSSTSVSPVLEGSFGSPAGPFIVDFVVDDPNDTSLSYSNGDTFTIRFSESTNRPGGTGTQSKLQVDSLFSFSDPLGDGYSGQWVNPKTFKITATDVNNGEPKLGITTVEPTGTTQVKNSAATSLPSVGVSSPLSGSFGLFTVTQTVEQGGTMVTALPSGITSAVQLPADSSGQITVKRSEPTSNAVPGGTVQFVGNVIDITLGGGASCSSGCTISFSFAASDLPSNTDPLSVKMFHDKNNDGDFADTGEQLETAVTEESSGIFVAVATITSTSNVGIGIVTPTPSPPPQTQPSASPVSSSGGGGGGRTGVSVGGTTSGSSEGGFGGIIKPTDELTTPPKLPTWVRNVAGWWSLGIISEQYFTQGVKYMIKEKFVMVDDEAFDSPHPIHVPPWTKRVAGWWAEGKVSDMEYFRFVQWLVNHNIMPHN